MKRHPYLILGLLLVSLLGSFVQAQTVTLTANKVVADGSLVPVLTWTSSPVPDATCTATGAWSGVKSGSGTETLPAITAGKTYGLTCTWPALSGKATITWVAPTSNNDGSTITNLAGFDVVAGTSADALTQTTNVPNASARSQVINGLAAGTWYFAVIAYNTNDGHSGLSNVTSKVVGAPSVSVSASVAITIRPVPSPPVVTSVIVAGTPFVPVYRVGADGKSIGNAMFGLIPSGRECGAYVTTYRGARICRVLVAQSEVWPKTASTQNLAAPCA